MEFWKIIKSDLKRYKSHGKFEWFEPSIGVIILFRIGHSLRQIRFVPVRWLLNLLHLPIYMITCFFSGIHIARGASIGPGLRIFHYGCIVINSGVQIGENCTIRHGVTLGNRREDFDLPVLGDNVDIGAGAKILGAVHVGNDVSIGANAVVIRDVPDNSIAVGVPARIISKSEKDNEEQNTLF
ncbi:MAG: serine acetyltransferase [Bacteroidota bacterium]|nr:serine acetyltransferase [Bacteroidota bacterium]